MYQGSCLCGSITLTITGTISDIIHCHCSLCRKSTGSAFATNGFVQTNDLVITKGQEMLQSFELRPGKKRHFCRQCASPIFSDNAAEPTRVRLRLGILDSAITEKPISHNFVSSKANWDSLDCTLPHYDGHEPSRSVAK